MSDINTQIDEKAVKGFIAKKLKSFGYISGERKCYTPKYGEDAYTIENWDSDMVGVFLAQDVLALIESECLKARKDELKEATQASTFVTYDDGTKGVAVSQLYISDRLAQLESGQDE